MLDTPLGKIEICIDNKPIEYTYRSVDLDKSCLDLSGRFLITITFHPDNNAHEITCKIKEYVPSNNDDIESGECLELKSFYSNEVKLSIGMEGEAGYFSNGERVSGDYDYDNEYNNDGVSYLVFEKTKTTEYKFGIAWLENYNEANEIETWLGADPTIM